MLVLRLLAGSPEDEVQDGLVDALRWGGKVLEGLNSDGRPVLLPAVLAHGGVRSPALQGGVQELEVADGVRGQGGELVAGEGPAGWAIEVQRVNADVFCVGRPGRCRTV